MATLCRLPTDRIQRHDLRQTLRPFGDILTIDASLAVSGIYKERVEEYEVFLNLKLFPIGVAARGVLTVMVSRDGSFRGGFDDSLDYLGISVRDMLGRLSLGPGVQLR